MCRILATIEMVNYGGMGTGVKLQPKARAAQKGRRLHRHSSSMELGTHFDGDQAKAGAFGPRGEQGLEDPFGNGQRYTGPAVVNLDYSGISLTADHDVQCSSLPGSLSGIEDEVQDRPLNQLLMAGKGQALDNVREDLYADEIWVSLGDLDHLTDHPAKIECL